MNDKVFDKFPILETDRLKLVRHDLSHADDMYTLRTDEQVMAYLDVYPPKSVSDIEIKIKENIKDFDDKKGINWIITKKDSPEAIGYMGLWRIDQTNHRGELGYALKREYWNQGIATEAATKIINFGFDDIQLNTVMANTNPLNSSSQALLKKLGFVREAYFRQDYFFDGRYLDSAIYGLIKDDWKFSTDKK